jgi:hypothetical protein
MAQEKVDVRRSFEVVADGGLKKYFISMPTADQVRKADWHYSKIYNKAMVEGITTSAEMLDLLKQRHLYDADYETQAEELRTKIATTILHMEASTSETEKYSLALSIKTLRDDLFQWNQRLSGPLKNTCEQIADDAKIEFLTSLIIQDEAGKPTWKTYDEFLNDPDQLLTMRARIEVYLWAQGLERNFLDNTPEQLVIDAFHTSQLQQAQKKLPEEVASLDPEVVEDQDKKPKKVRSKKE